MVARAAARVAARARLGMEELGEGGGGGGGEIGKQGGCVVGRAGAGASGWCRRAGGWVVMLTKWAGKWMSYGRHRCMDESWASQCVWLKGSWKVGGLWPWHCSGV